MKVLYVMSSYNIYGGTPKKTLDILKQIGSDGSIYVYGSGYKEFREKFEETGAVVHGCQEGDGLIQHIRKLLIIIDENKVDIVQVQFFMGELLGFLISLLRPKVKLVCAFVGPFGYTGVRKWIANIAYRRFDAFVFISKYVERTKIEQFPFLQIAKSKVIYNGTSYPVPSGDTIPQMRHPALLDVAGLVDWKNGDVLIEAMNLIVNKSKRKEVTLYIAGDGPERGALSRKIENYSLEKNVVLLGYQKNIGGLLKECDVYVHPAYKEGFGIAVAEAMMAGKPVLLANQSALPELIVNEESGLLVDAFRPIDWAQAILRVLDNNELSAKFANNAVNRACSLFSIDLFVGNYLNLYEEILCEN